MAAPRTAQIAGEPSPARAIGRGRAAEAGAPAPTADAWSNGQISVRRGDSLDFYRQWPAPAVIVSDGGYGILGFEGDTSDHLGLPDWYRQHIAAWSRHATPATTLWFWNSEIGWAAVHPVLEANGWRYVNANIWNKGVGHIAGNVNTKSIRRFPVVSEVCVQYAYEARIDDLPLKRWLLKEWDRTGLPRGKANEACGVADAATRKYLDQGRLWYFPPPAAFLQLQQYANRHGDPGGRPYFCIRGKQPGTAEQWAAMRAPFSCPHGFTNVWDHPPLHGKERYKTNGASGKALHFNQKPVSLMQMIIQASSGEQDVVWEPFGGLFSACVAAWRSRRRGFGGEINPTYFRHGVQRLVRETRQSESLLYSPPTHPLNSATEIRP